MLQVKLNRNANNACNFQVPRTNHQKKCSIIKLELKKKDLSFENQKHNSIQHNPSRIQLNKVKTTQNKKKENFLRTENTKNNRKKKEQERNKTTATEFQ